MTDTMVYSLTIVSALIVLLGILRLRHVSIQALMLGLMGAVIGLLLGALASVPLSKLPSPLGGVLPVVVSVLFTVILVGLVIARRSALLNMAPFLRSEEKTKAKPKTEDVKAADTSDIPHIPQILVDTSVIIDGRIADIASAGFVPGRLAVPRFVLAELQNIADSDDAMRRGRGRRGLDVLNQLREMSDVSVEIIEDDVASIREVDAKLVALAQKFSCNVLTTDYNLNRVAQIQGVRVLNVNELSNAIRPVVLPGENLQVRVVQTGKERNQGVGYLADGTMIVVEDGDKLIGQDVSTEVTRVFQTVAGKMIFAVPRKGNGAAQPAQANEPAAHKSQTADNQTQAPADSSANGARKTRFGRGRGRGGAKPANSDQNTPKTPEERIIAATNESQSPRVQNSPTKN